jgi:hypothetical protein
MAEPRNLSFNEALQLGLAVSLSRSQGRSRYERILGDGDANVGSQIRRNQVFKSEDFWRNALDKFVAEAGTSALSKIKSSSAARARAMRSAGGLLAGAASPNLGQASSVGPMLGGDSMLGGSSSLGMRKAL